MKRILKPLAIGVLILFTPGRSLGVPGEDSLIDPTPRLLLEAVENQYRGGYSADVVFVRESFVHGRDSLQGRLDFNDGGGERQLQLRGGGEALEWWSRDFGREQWWKDGETDRVHRIPFRSFKKPAFASLLTYEDLLKLPADYLLNYQSCQKLSETDSTCEIRLSFKPVSNSRYGSYEVTLQKKPALLRKVVFFNPAGRRLKSLEATGYRLEKGKYLPTGLTVFDSDSLTSLRLSLSNSRMHNGAQTAGRDKTDVPAERPPREMALVPDSDPIAPSDSGETPDLDEPDPN